MRLPPRCNCPILQHCARSESLTLRCLRLVQVSDFSIGQVVGDVHALEHLELDAKARINGDLYYRYMEMVMGAQISGQLNYLDDSAQSAQLDAVLQLESENS